MAPAVDNISGDPVAPPLWLKVGGKGSTLQRTGLVHVQGRWQVGSAVHREARETQVAMTAGCTGRKAALFSQLWLLWVDEIRRSAPMPGTHLAVSVLF